MSLDSEALIEPEIIVFDSKPLNGLRGILSFHILVFHSLFYSDKNFNIYGQVRIIDQIIQNQFLKKNEILSF